MTLRQRTAARRAGAPPSDDEGHRRERRALDLEGSRARRWAGPAGPRHAGGAMELFRSEEMQLCQVRGAAGEARGPRITRWGCRRARGRAAAAARG